MSVEFGLHDSNAPILIRFELHRSILKNISYMTSEEGVAA